MAESEEERNCSDKNVFLSEKMDQYRDVDALPVKGPPSEKYRPPTIPPLLKRLMLIDMEPLPVRGPPSDVYLPPVIPLFTGIRGLQGSTIEKKQKPYPKAVDSGYLTSEAEKQNHDDEGGQGAPAKQPSN